MPARDTTINAVKVPTFSAESSRDKNAIIISMSGNADTVVYEQLKTFLDEVHGAASRAEVDEAVFEVKDLYFMNSSCLSLFLRLINMIIESKNVAKYKIRFRANPNLRWQKKSLQAIVSYAREIVSVE